MHGQLAGGNFSTSEVEPALPRASTIAAHGQGAPQAGLLIESLGQHQRCEASETPRGLDACDLYPNLRCMLPSAAVIIGDSGRHTTLAECARHLDPARWIRRSSLALGLWRACTPATVPTVPKSPQPPRWVKPQLTRLVDEAPAGSGWLHEIKYDDQCAAVARGRVRLEVRAR